MGLVRVLVFIGRLTDLRVWAANSRSQCGRQLILYNESGLTIWEKSNFRDARDLDLRT